MEPLTNVLLNAGVAGAVLAWFMWRQEKQNGEIVRSNQEIVKAVNRLARAQMIFTLGRNDTPPSVKRLAQDLSDELASEQSGAIKDSG